MKIFLVLLQVLIWFNVCIAGAQYKTTVKITDLNQPSLESAASRNVSTLLTEINLAQSEKRGIKFEQLSMTPDAQVVLSVLWEVCPFRSLETDIVEKGLSTTGGQFQVRNIAVVMTPLDGEKFDSDKRQEVVVNFNTSGVITNICFTINKLQYARLMRSSNPVDLYNRQILLDFVENFRTAYNRKDIDYLNQVYSDDALIITGRVLEKDGKTTYSYTSQSKKEYLDKMKGIFANNERINIEFEDIKVSKHAKKDIYGIVLKQYWNTYKSLKEKGYSDVGYLFLMVDLQNKDKPMIHVRTWQPNDPSLEEDPGKIMNLSDFTNVSDRL